MSSAFTFMHSPVGTLTLVARGQCLAAVLWEEERENRVRLGALHRDDQCPGPDEPTVDGNPRRHERRQEPRTDGRDREAEGGASTGQHRPLNERTAHEPATRRA